jgi:3-phosphoinositide dependent protein kinase-1
MRATHIATGQEYAIKVLDKAHLIKNKKMSTALAEKNALVRLGAGHPGFVRLSSAFHDEWSLCKWFFYCHAMRRQTYHCQILYLTSRETGSCKRVYLNWVHSQPIVLGIILLR